jgi:hypothetical protein
MDLTIQIPDELARDLAAAGGDLSRRALEGFALEEFKSGRLTKSALRQLLGFSTHDQLEGFLSAHAVVEDLPARADVARESQGSPELSIKQFDNLSDLLLNSPFAGANLDLERSKDHPRSVDLG